MDIDKAIHRVEHRWLKILNDHITQSFQAVFLPSHDASHHRRVWMHAKNLIVGLSEKSIPFETDYIEALLVSAFFHDLGMIRSTSPDHGHISSGLCREFFTHHDLGKPARFEEILEAIEQHDIKDGESHLVLKAGQPCNILTLLTLADDIDALGTIGIYRYTEIYLHRQADLSSLGHRILANVSGRFRNMEHTLSQVPEILKPLKEGYDEIIEFFTRYNAQLHHLEDPAEEYTGDLGIVNFIRKFSMEKRIHPVAFLRTLNTYDAEGYIHDFFSKLEHEIKSTAFRLTS